MGGGPLVAGTRSHFTGSMNGPGHEASALPTDRTRLAFVGTLGQLHAGPIDYDLARLRSLVERLEPDLLAVEADRAAWEAADTTSIPSEVLASLVPAARFTDTVVVPIGGASGRELAPPEGSGLAGARASLIRGADGLLDALARGVFDSPEGASRGLYPHVCALLCRVEYAAASATGRQAWRETNERILANLVELIRSDPGRRVLVAVTVGGGAGRRRSVAHRSISPITMSIEALIAMTSESRCPSTIFGIAERFT